MAPPELTSRPPRPAVVDHVSPSLLSAWNRCRLRAGFDLDPAAGSLRRMGLRAAVGIVAHAVLARRFATHEEVADAWAAESSRAYALLAQAWAPASPPAPQNWPAWALTKHQVTKRVVPNSTTDSAVVTSAYGSSFRAPERLPLSRQTAPGLPWRERWLEDGVLGLKGRPDLVERASGVLTVADFKTGRGDLTDDRRDQLLIYAALVRSSLGELPMRAEIRHADGSAQGFAIRSEAVDDVVRRASHARSVLNDAATGHQGLEAAPGPETCPTCPFRVACSPFLQTYQPDWVCGQVVVGRVLSTGRLGARPYIDLDVVAPRWRSRQLRVVGLAQETPTRGEMFSVSDFEGSLGTGFARWNTLSWTWPQ
ncbi:PD-(D/E)XK nuclease family protein [Kribbella sp. NPDC058693]|uniref:PD-(D/E)XK nuclease family protein n=1 Tax=Kribbella sp. NPDC058693 TaxID=3346602 RepID=UPI003664A399